MRRRSAVGVRLVPGDRLSDEEKTVWAQVQEDEPSLTSPFFRPEFTEIVAATRSGVSVAIVDLEEAEPCFFPFQRHAFRRAGPVGSRLSDYHGLVTRIEPRFDVLALVRSCGLSGWDFDGLDASQGIFQPYHRRSKVSPTIVLSSGFSGFVEERAGAGSDQISDVHRQVERLEAEVGPVRFEVHVVETSALELLIAWKSAQYERTGAVDIFAFPWVRAVVEGVHHARHEGFAGLLSVLYAADRPIAAHLGPRSRSTWHYWLPAYDRRYSRYSPGLILLLSMAEAATSLGLHTIDLGKGEALYKRRLANGGVQLAEGSVDATLPASIAASAYRFGRRVVRHTPLARRADLMATRRLFA